MTGIRVVQESAESLEAYGSVPMTLLVESIYRVEPLDEGFRLVEEPVETAWIKDYEQFEEDRPVNLAKKYDFGVRGIFAAFDDDTRVGGAIVAPGEDDWWGSESAVLVDIRVAPSHRRLGIGRQLIAAAVAWSRERNLQHLTIETQNVNVPGCRFYEAMRCSLVAANPGAYPGLPGEVQLIWRLVL